MNSIRGMMGGGHRQAFGDTTTADRGSPWSDQSNSSAGRDLGVNDVGRGSGAGTVDQASIDRQQDAEQDRDWEQDEEQDAMEDTGNFGGEEDCDYA